jgi:hypothetical protein
VATQQGYDTHLWYAKVELEDYEGASTKQGFGLGFWKNSKTDVH